MSNKGVIIEYDFAAIDGAGLLFLTTKKFLRDLDDIAFDEKVEAKYLVGNDYQDGLAKYFAVVKTKKTAAKAARDLAEAFGRALDAEFAKPVSPAFRNFVKALTDRGVRVIISTRTDTAKAAAAFAPLLSENVAICHEESLVYGCVKRDSWRRACAANKLRLSSALAVTGSGLGVKSALRAGVPSLAVTNSHVAYQDFSGADEVVRELGAPAAKKVLEILRID